MIDEDLAEFVIKYLTKQGSSYAEVRLQEISSNGFMLKNSIPQLSGFEETSGIGIRFLSNNNILNFVSSNSLDKDKIKSLLSNALNTANGATKIGEKVDLSEEKTSEKKYEVKQKVKLADISPEEKLKVLFDADKAIQATKVNTIGRYLSLSDSLVTEYFANSEGSSILATIPRMTFFYFLTVQEKNKTIQRFLQYGATKGYELVKEWDAPKIVTDEVKAMQQNLSKGIKLPAKKMDVIACPQVVGIMVHESAGHPYEADRIFGREAAQAGESFIEKDMIGHQIGNEVVNVVDDPTLPNSYGHYLYDNEGVEARRKFLIKDGKINELLHNRETAMFMGLKSNGSSRAVEYNRESIVRMSNTFMLPGEHTEEELIEDVKDGIYMKNFMEWNIDDKRLNQKYVGAESYLIKNGEIKGPVISPSIEISTPELYKAIDAVAKKPEYHSGSCGKGEPMQAIPVWFGGPSIRLRNISIK